MIKSARIDKEIFVCGTVGLTLALSTFFIPFTRFIFTYLTILLHEFGHSLFAWIYGSPSIPSFDFTYGGGVALSFQQNIYIVYCVYALMVYGVWFLRHNTIPLISLVAFFIFYICTVHTEWRDIVRIYMGHGTEALISGIFLYRGLSGSQTINNAERSLYFSCAFFLAFVNLDFSLNLINDNYFLREYMVGKGGFLMNDFHKLAEHHSSHGSIPIIAKVNIFFIFLFPTIAIGMSSLRSYLIYREFG